MESDDQLVDLTPGVTCVVIENENFCFFLLSVFDGSIVNFLCCSAMFGFELISYDFLIGELMINMTEVNDCCNWIRILKINFNFNSYLFIFRMDLKFDGNSSIKMD